MSRSREAQHASVMHPPHNLFAHFPLNLYLQFSGTEKLQTRRGSVRLAGGLEDPDSQPMSWHFLLSHWLCLVGQGLMGWQKESGPTFTAPSRARDGAKQWPSQSSSFSLQFKQPEQQG